MVNRFQIDLPHQSHSRCASLDTLGLPHITVVVTESYFPHRIRSYSSTTATPYLSLFHPPGAVEDGSCFVVICRRKNDTQSFSHDLSLRSHSRLPRFDTSFTLNLAYSLFCGETLARKQHSVVFFGVQVIRPRAHNPLILWLKPHSVANKRKTHPCGCVFFYWLRGRDLNHMTFGLSLRATVVV